MRKMFLTSALALGMSFAANAHDEGHGPKLKAADNAPKHGGKVVSLIEKGNESTMVHKAELVRTDKKVQLFIYGGDVPPAEGLKDFSPKAKGVAWSGAKTNRKKHEFNLEQKDGAFVGTLPSGANPPLTVEVIVSKNGKEYLSAFPVVE
jgi:hypothetical protein